MKMITSTIAMILVLVMIAVSFSSCFTVAALKNGKENGYGWLFLSIPLDVVSFPLQLIGIAIGMPIFELLSPGEVESQYYLASAEYGLFTEYYPLVEKINSLPEAELAAIEQMFNSTPETEIISSMEKVASLSETRRASLIGLYTSLPESEIAASIQRINALPETERVSLLRTFNALSDEEIDTLIREINPKAETVNVAMVSGHIHKPYMALSYQY